MPYDRSVESKLRLLRADIARMFQFLLHSSTGAVEAKVNAMCRPDVGAGHGGDSSSVVQIARGIVPEGLAGERKWFEVWLTQATYVNKPFEIPIYIQAFPASGYASKAPERTAVPTNNDR